MSRNGYGFRDKTVAGAGDLNSLAFLRLAEFPQTVGGGRAQGLFAARRRVDTARLQDSERMIDDEAQRSGWRRFSAVGPA